MTQVIDTPDKTYFVYILFSQRIKKYYVGSSSDVPKRLEEHNHPSLFNNWSRIGIPWVLIFSLECSSKGIALKIEKHIKMNKSKIYIENLIKYPEISLKLKQKYG